MNANHYILFGIQKNYKHKLIVPKPQCIWLLNSAYNINFYNLMPKNFTITTNHGSSVFNIEILKDVSPVISEFVHNNNDVLQYRLNIDDQANVLSKYALLCSGEAVSISEDEVPSFLQILDLLNIENFPNFIDDFNPNIKIVMKKKRFRLFLTNAAPQTFIIQTRKNQYHCNIFGIMASNVIMEYLLKNPKENQYSINFNDECNEFQLISDIFNFKQVKITANNMKVLKEMAELLQINAIMKDIDKFAANYYEFSEIIDKNQELIDSIEDLFYELYNIKEKTVENVKKYIIDASFTKTESDVQELAAFILQVIKTDIHLHPQIIELIIELQNEAQETNKLDILVPFIVQKLLMTFAESNWNCSFVYQMYKHKMIPKEDIIVHLINLFENNISDRIFIALNWFLTEAKEINPNIKRYIIGSPNKKQSEFLLSYFKNGIDDYEKMRESNKPDNELTNVLQNDDVESFKSLIIKNRLDISKIRVPYNIYEDVVQNGETNLIDYVSAYGSIKCFKYLLLNHEKVDRLTFCYAISSGNNEIIRIVDQKALPLNDPKYREKIRKAPMSRYRDINTSIKKHQNDLFDWIFENKYMNNDSVESTINDLVMFAMSHGNVHVLVEMIYKGFNFIIERMYTFSSTQYIYQEVIQTAAKNGFYKLSLLLHNIIMVKAQGLKMKNSQIFLEFGNTSIFELILENLDLNGLEECFSATIALNNHKQIDYLFSCFNKFDFNLRSLNIQSILEKAIKMNQTETFIYLITSFRKQKPDIFNNFNWASSICVRACELKNFEAVKTIVNLYIETQTAKKTSSPLDFTNPFLTAIGSKSIEICKYLIDKKLLINFDIVSEKIQNIVLDEEIFSLLIENSNPEVKEKLFNNILYPMIIQNNKNIVKYLLNSNFQFQEDSNILIYAVNTNDLEMVNIVLNYKSKPCLINKITQNGTALLFAVKNNNLSIVKRLLSLPGINPSLYSSHNETPLITAVKNLNIQIIYEILNFYGDKINQTEINEVIQLVLNNLRSSYNSPYSFYNSNKSGSTFQNPNLQQIIDKLVSIKSLDPNIIVNGTSLLIYATNNNQIETVKKLLKLEKTNPNIYNSSNGETPLMIAIRKKLINIANILIEDPRTDINMENYNNENPFMIAVKNNSYEIIRAILKNEKFEQNPSDLTYLFSTVNEELSKELMVLKCIDVNATYQNPIKKFSNIVEFSYPYAKQTKLVYESNKSNVNMIDLIINHPSFDQEKSNIEKALFIAYQNENIVISNKLSKIIKNVSNYTEKGVSLLHLACYKFDGDIITKIISSSNSDSIKDNVLNIFVQMISYNIFYMDTSISEKALNTFNTLYKYDQEHSKLFDFNKLLPNKKSFFTTIFKQSCIAVDIVNFLLDHGADPNIQDGFGIYPLEDAIISNSIKIANILIKTNKIDFSKIITNKNSIMTINSVNKKGFNESDPITLFELVISKNNEEIIDNIFKCTNLDLSNCGTNNALSSLFIGYTYESVLHKVPVSIIKKILEYDKNHAKTINLNQVLPNGKTFFTTLPYNTFNFADVVNLLIEYGADPNIPDKFDVYPLEYAIQLNSYEYVHTLIESKKIDYTKKIPNKNHFSSNNAKYKSYLHLVARSSEYKIVSEFVRKKLIDIDIRDDLNETPKDEALRFNQRRNAKMLSKDEDIMSAASMLANNQSQGDQSEWGNKGFEFKSKASPEVWNFPNKCAPNHWGKDLTSDNNNNDDDYKGIILYNTSWGLNKSSNGSSISSNDNDNSKNSNNDFSFNVTSNNRNNDFGFFTNSNSNNNNNNNNSFSFNTNSSNNNSNNNNNNSFSFNTNSNSNNNNNNNNNNNSFSFNTNSSNNNSNNNNNSFSFNTNSNSNNNNNNNNNSFSFNTNSSNNSKSGYSFNTNNNSSSSSFSFNTSSSRFNNNTNSNKAHDFKFDFPAKGSDSIASPLAWGIPKVQNPFGKAKSDSASPTFLPPATINNPFQVQKPPSSASSPFSSHTEFNTQNANASSKEEPKPNK